MSLQSMKRRLQGHSSVGELHHKLDLRSMSSYSSTWVGVDFIDCKMQLTDMSGSNFKRVAFQSSSLPLSNFSRSTIDNVLFLDCDLEQAVFAGAVLKDVRFRKCRLAYSTFNGATVRSASFENCNLHGADLDYIECNDASYHGSNLWGVKAALGCSFWNGRFDPDQIRMFAALCYRLTESMPGFRVHFESVGGEKIKLVNRLMSGGKEEHENQPEEAQEAPEAQAVPDLTGLAARTACL